MTTTSSLRSTVAALLIVTSPLAPDEGQQVLVDLLVVRRGHAMGQPGIDLEPGALDQLGREQRGVGDRNDLVVVAVHDQRRDVDALEVIGEVGLAECLDAVVGGLYATHNPLPPPPPDTVTRAL